MFRRIIFALASLAASVCFVLVIARAHYAPAATQPASEAPAEPQAAGAVPPQHKNFIPVAGRALDARLEEAVRRGRAASPRAPFWAAYSFDVREGVSVDVWLNPGQGPRQIFSAGPNVSLDPAYETRNLGVFLLYDPGSAAPTKVEVYNLETRKEFGGHPVYWLGHAEAGESMRLLQPLTRAGAAEEVAAPSAVIIALHKDRGVGAILEDVIRQTDSDEVRDKALLWLAQVPGENGFLAEVARDARQSLAVRKQAVYAIGVSKEVGAVPELERLYDAADEWELKKQIIFAASIHRNEEPKLRFLRRIAESDPDAHARKEATFWLSNQTGAKK